MHLTLVGYWRSGTEPQWPDPHDFIDRAWSNEDREVVADYLRTGFVARAFIGRSWCRICGQQQLGALEMTDMTYVWPEGLAHYVEAHAVRLPPRFEEHVLSRVDEFQSHRVEIDVGWWQAVDPSNPSDG